jgi:hypothetical protein
MPVHHLLEEILNEYIAAAGLQSGQPLFQSVNSVGTAVTGPLLHPPLTHSCDAWAGTNSGSPSAGRFILRTPK